MSDPKPTPTLHSDPAADARPPRCGAFTEILPIAQAALLKQGVLSEHMINPWTKESARAVTVAQHNGQRV
jgi:hypothetical protein